MPRLFVFMGLLALLCGCSPRYRFDIKAGSCLNPKGPNCEVDARDSYPLEMRIYPLRSCPDPTALKWDAFWEEEEVQKTLKDVWQAAPERFHIERLKSEEIDKPFPRKTHCFLLVSMGRLEGTRSVITHRFKPLRHRTSIMLDRHDIFIQNTTHVIKETDKK